MYLVAKRTSLSGIVFCSMAKVSAVLDMRET
jgi:hypothetical protein